MPQRFAMPDCDSWQVPGGTLLCSRHNGAKIVVTPDVAAVARSCDRFLTLEDHVQRILRLYPGLREQPEVVGQVLDSLRSSGLLVSAEALCGEVRASTPETRGADRPTICITTCDRPDQVKRLFESLLRNVRLSRFQQIYLIDDSRDPVAIQQNAEAVEEFRVVSPVDARHVGPDRQEAIRQALAAAVPDAEDALACLLDRNRWGDLPTYGRARNFALLLTAGQRCLMLDDDVLCEAWRIPGAGEGVAFGGEREAGFLAGPADLQRLAPLEEDPLQAHAGCLGLTLDEALKRLGQPGLEPGLLADAPGEFIDRVGRDSCVLVTQCGTVGDPGTEDNSWLTLLAPDSVRRLLNNAGGLSGAQASRQVWLGYQVPTFTGMANMSQVTGLDNRALLPPYLSGLRGEDRLFGSLVGYLHPRALALDYDWAISHWPQPERRGNPEGDLGVPRAGAGLLDLWVIERTPGNSSSSPEARLLLLAGELGVLAQQSDRELRRDFGRLLTQAQVERLQRLDEQLQSTGTATGEWQAWLTRQRNALSQALQGTPSLADSPWVPAGMSEEQVWSAVRATAGAYASLLRHWPALRSAAAEPGVLR